MKCILLINVKMITIVGILTFISRINSTSESFEAKTIFILLLFFFAGPRSTVSNVSGYRCVSDCRSRGREFDPGLVPYFRGD